MATPNNPEKAPESIFEKVIYAPQRILSYIYHNPLKSAGHFLYITAGLAGLRHLGLFNNIPSTWGWGYLKAAIDTPAQWSQYLYTVPIQNVGRNIGGYSPWVSRPAQIFSDASRNMLNFSGAPPAP